MIRMRQPRSQRSGAASPNGPRLISFTSLHGSPILKDFPPSYVEKTVFYFTFKSENS